MIQRYGHVVALERVTVNRGANTLLDHVDWHVRPGERWVVMGPNGSGKTTLISVASTYIWPSEGSVSVLGRELGTVDVRDLRRRIGIVSAALEARIPRHLTAEEVVRAGATGALAPWWDRGETASRDAAELLELVGCGALAGGQFELLSSGERQRVQIARALALDPALLLLDEPFAGLDLGARERMADLLSRLNAEPGLSATVVVTHHVEEIAPGTSHALVLRSGRVVASGPMEEVVTSAVMSAAFDLELAVEARHGRFTARATRSPAD